MGSCEQSSVVRNLCSILTLRRQSWATLILWQAGIALMLWGFTAFLHRSQDASFFDRAGRQRLLAQQVREHLQMVKEGHKEDRARLLEHAELFGKGLSALEREHEVQEAWQPHGESEDILAEVRALWDPYRPQLERLARLPVGAKYCFSGLMLPLGPRPRLPMIAPPRSLRTRPKPGASAGSSSFSGW